jgi:DNA-binding MarR family transcriptional regulator
LYYVFAASQQAHTLLAEALVGAPLTAEEYAVYSALRELERATPTELARHLGMPVTTALDYVRVMVGRDHAAKHAHPRDQRSYQLELTAPGHRAHDDTERLFAAADRLLAARLGARRPAVIRALGDLLDAGEAAIDDFRQQATDSTG